MTWPNYDTVSSDSALRQEITRASQMQDMIGRVADALGYEESPAAIHDKLIREGLTEEEAYLTYVAGKLVHKDRQEGKKK